MAALLRAISRRAPSSRAATSRPPGARSAQHQSEHKENCEHTGQGPKPESRRPSPSLAARFEKPHSPSDTPVQRRLDVVHSQRCRTRELLSASRSGSWCGRWFPQRTWAGSSRHSTKGEESAGLVLHRTRRRSGSCCASGHLHGRRALGQRPEHNDHRTPTFCERREHDDGRRERLAAQHPRGGSGARKGGEVPC